ncbi:MAG: nicotinate phosphoribosyltransferase [Phenylobacterium sp.]|uniref:nicotinate phosphoribosyltransferase n=1 Tax=Phenylobacterium sp. TaxID=1871053 RepID=UPI0011F44F9C|nr:nicotinate phosphoribosyltransferase [Phenylobacterium sp.]TAL29064.1 MAG: nicotinate phosphoribosyltransferase [Phenylobacterium sp.]
MTALNPITQIDGYKLDHRRQYPANTTRVYSNWTPRSSRIPGVDRVVLLGLQYFLREHLEVGFSDFFRAGVDGVCEEYERRVNGYLGPNEIGTQHIRDLHKLGYLPLEFRAIPEGTTVPLRVPMLTVENTHPDFAWLVNYFETLMSNVLWLPCTSATTARRMRQLLDSAAARTGSPAGFVDWQGHDFSFRGMAGPEAAALSGMGHLLYFTGTDTIPALDLIERNYGTAADYLLGGSVAATEHSVMCAGGEECELDTFDRLLKLYPSGIVSVVSDTWDLWNVLTSVLPELKDRIMARPGKLVIRPDSGDPVKIICGDPEATDPAAQQGVIRLLWDIFGGTTTDTGHRLLDQHIGCIYGDSINFERAKAITDGLAANGFASANMVFGVGSYTYQYVTRDTFGFAMKATWVEIDGKGRAIFKTPRTDDGTKNSARGRLAVALGDAGDLVLINEATAEEEARSLLRPVWRNGLLAAREGFDVIRARAREDMKAHP